MELLLYLLNCLYLSPQVFSLLLFDSLPHFTRRDGASCYVVLRCPLRLTHSGWLLTHQDSDFAVSEMLFFLVRSVWEGMML